MGRKVHPYGFRIGVIRDWSAKWYADRDYAEFLQEDLKLRKAIQTKYAEAGISQIEIERQANKVSVTIYTAWPGIVIGRGGQRVDEMRHYLESLIDKKIQLNIREVRQPELDAYLVAKSVAERIERRVAYRRVMKQAVFRTIQAGAKGIRITCAGRLAGAEIARSQTMHEGQVPLHTLRADIDYGLTEARTTLGRIGVKVWIYKGDIVPEVEEKIEAMPAVMAAGEEAGEEPVAVAEPVTEPSEEVAPAEAPAKAVSEKGEELVAAVEATEAPVEVVVEKGEELAVAVEATETPAEPVVEKGDELAATAEVTEATAKAVAGKGEETAPVQKTEEKPVRKRATRSAKAAPSPEPEEKPARKRIARKTKTATASEKATETKKKIAADTKPAELSSPVAKEEEVATAEDLGEKDVTTQEGEISQES